ncbi:MAG: glycyl-radical enzyme activating protein [Candidatus Xenobiia bacterium LiM19]
MDTIEGLIFDIQGFSLHDGPGGRTLVFMSGCPLRCRWCANPEGQLLHRRLMYRSLHCRCSTFSCISCCPHGAIERGSSSPLVFDRALCERCETFSCVEGCYRDALKASGAWYTISSLMKELERDRRFWGAGGGVTFGGGDPVVQHRFVSEALKTCRSHYIHTALETSACCSFEILREVLLHVDWAFIDVKHMDSLRHCEATGLGNEEILRNISALASSGWKGRLIVRIPLITGFNDSEDNLAASAGFLRSCGIGEVNLLPFHRLGASKYEQLGLCYDYASLESPGSEHLKTCGALMEQQGLRCYLGYETPF